MNKFKFTEQIGQRGLFSEISLNASNMDPDGSDLIINYYADVKWEIPCKAGVLLFFDYFKRKRSGSLVVNIGNIDWIPVDTNNITVLYSTIIALCKELNFSVDNLNLDKEHELFVLPEPRKK